MNCLIVDDDPLICDLIEHFCSKTEEITSVLTTQSGFEAVNLIQTNSFDLVFLDFDLPDITGKDILNVLNKETKVIMITSKSEFAAESYNYDQIVDFLVKPIDFARFYKAVQKTVIQNPISNDNIERLFVKDGNKLVKVNLEEVHYFKSESNYISIAFKGRKIMTLMTMKDLAEKVPDYFTRVHRSFIVNLNAIDAIERGNVIIDKQEIPISESYEKELLEKIKLLN